MTSSRLPGKVLLPVLGLPMLHYLIDRLRAVPSLDGIVLATTTNEDDDVLEEYALKQNISCFRGSEHDVMSRVIGAAELVNADIVVEITADCPIIDPQIIEQVIRIYENNNVDYVSNNNVRSYPDGMDVQVFSLDTLKKSSSMTEAALDHEHVTLHIRNNPHLFSRINLIAPPRLHWPELAVTLDELADYNLIRLIIEHFSHDCLGFSCLDIIGFVRNNPKLEVINKHVHRKGDT